MYPDLVCPACRQPPVAWPIERETALCTNPACARVHDVLEGTDIQLVTAGPDDFDASLAPLVQFADEETVQSWITTLERGSEQWERAVMVGMYARSHDSENRAMLTRLHDHFLASIVGSIGCAVDLGCGVGVFTEILARRSRCSVIGLDSWALALRMAHALASPGPVYVPTLGGGGELTVSSIPTSDTSHPPIRWVCGDVMNPPLPAASFDLVTAIALFDSVADPALALGQASALLRAGGLLLVAQPDAWNAHVTPSDAWMALDGDAWRSLMSGYGLVPIDAEDGFEWTLARTPRTEFRYVSHAVLAKRSEG